MSDVVKVAVRWDRHVGTGRAAGGYEKHPDGRQVPADIWERYRVAEVEMSSATEELEGAMAEVYEANMLAAGYTKAADD